MAIIKQQKCVPFEPEQMYDLVNRVEEYPDFLPWCARCEVLSRDEEEVRATLVVSAAGIEKSFTTLNRLHKNQMIEIKLLDGPFNHLEGFWRFEKVSEGTIISLDMDFELAGGWLNFAFEPFFLQVANTFVDAFCQRAEELYAQPV